MLDTQHDWMFPAYQENIVTDFGWLLVIIINWISFRQSHTKVNQCVSWMHFQLQDLDNYRMFSCTRRYISPGHCTQQEM